MRRWGLDRAIAAIRNSIENNWLSIHESSPLGKLGSKRVNKPEPEFGLDDTVWTGWISTVVRAVKNGERMEADYVQRQFFKAIEHTPEARILKFMRQELSEVEIQSVIAIIREIPGEGKKEAE